jgi:hypothetical protein
MSCCKRAFGLKIFFVISIISLLIVFGCRCEETVSEQKVNKPEDIDRAIESPIFVMVLAQIYYAEMGRWPDSVYDLKNYNSKYFSDINWSILHDNIIFEKLPEGGLKIISNKPDFNYTVTISKPPHIEKAGLQN